MKLRKVTSLTTLLSFILLVITSVILYVTPQGKIAFWANWKYWGLGKEEWGALHTNIGFLFITAGLLHTLINIKAIIAYLKNSEKKMRVFTPDFNVALAITLLITLFTLFSLPPISSIQTFGTALKDKAAEEYGEPPYGHAEASTLRAFCKRTGLDADDAMKALQKAGLAVESDQSTLAEIAKANKMTPQQIYDMIKPAPVEEDEVASFPDSPGFGFGRQFFERYCRKYGLDPAVTIEKLAVLGIKAEMADAMRDIADRNETESSAIFEAIRQISEQE